MPIKGGMLVTDNEDLHRRVLVLRDHGREPGDRFFRNTEIAYKYKMGALQAALGLAQLERIDELIDRKREMFSWYYEELSGLDLALNYEAPGTKSTYWMATIVIPQGRMDKECLMRLLEERHVDTRPFFHPLSSIPAYHHLKEARRARQSNIVSYRIAPYAINLPSALNLTQQQVRYICDSLKTILNS